MAPASPAHRRYAVTAERRQHGLRLMRGAMSETAYKSDLNSNNVPKSPGTLSQIFVNHEGRISDKWEHYLPIYETALSRFIERDHPIRMLEIGVQNGGSIQIWSKYLPPGSIIVGIDIDRACADFPAEPNVSILIGDASDPVVLDRMLGDARFDVIIDDGSHRSDHIVSSFEACFSRLDPNGLYIVEDLHCSYYASHGGGFRLPGAAMEWFKGLADALNTDHFEADASAKLDSAELQRLRDLGRQIACVSFFDSVVLIQKLASEKRQPYRRIMTGREAPVVDIASQLAVFPAPKLRTLLLPTSAAASFAPTLLNAVASAREKVGQLRALLSQRAAEVERERAEWQRHAAEAERERAEWQRHAAEAERERAEWQRHAAEAELAGNSAETARAQTEAELIRLRTEHAALLSSTIWKATWPLRRFGAIMPPQLRTLLRRGAKLAWWSITLQLPTRLREGRAFTIAPTAGLPTAAEPVSALTAGMSQALAPAPVPTLAETLRRQFEYLEPLRAYPVPRAGRRLSIVTDGIDSDRLYGGVGTAIILASILARHLNAGLRLITRRQQADPGRFASVLAANGLSWRDEIEFVHAPSGVGDDVPVGNADLFLTTSWWTTQATKRAADPRRILYLLQEDERSFYPQGDERLRCAEVLSDPNLYFIVNSHLLFRHFIEGPEPLTSVRNHGTWFEPAFPKTLFYDNRQRRAHSSLKSFFFYARPKNLRNLYWRGLEAIGAAIEDGLLSPHEWRFIFVGREIERIVLPGGVTPKIVENLPWAEYAALIREIDLGMSLMDSPHPSYPPLDLAASGAVVVTNRFGLKSTLASYSENILCVDATVGSLKQGIEQGVEIASNETLRAANFARNGMLRDWTEALAPALQRCAEWISRGA
jgi:WsaF, C-terminal domain/WsaF, N-terminal domain